MIPNPIPEELRSDVLFITMGGNPVPNWVAARLLLKPGGKVFLLATPGVAGYASRLEQALMKAGVANIVKIKLPSESDGGAIYEEVRKVASNIKSGQMGLNYTGGTKAMAVHVYRALEKELAKGLPYPIFSYLDARRLKMWIDPKPGLALRDFEVRLAQESALTLYGLYQLHENYYVEKTSRYVTAEDALDSMMQVNLTGTGNLACKDWCKCLRNPKRPQKYLGGEELAQIELPTEGLMKPITDCFLTKIPRQRPSLGNLFRPWGFDSVEELAKWLEGSWLENYALAYVRDLAESCDLNDYSGGVEVRWKNRKFENDLQVMRGFQLFAISCQNSNIPVHNKEHLIEVSVRARQLGGDEARIALVCMTNEQKKLEDEVREWMDNPQSVRVFGQSDLPNLQNLLQKWFTEG